MRLYCEEQSDRCEAFYGTNIRKHNQSFKIQYFDCNFQFTLNVDAVRSDLRCITLKSNVGVLKDRGQLINMQQWGEMPNRRTDILVLFWLG